MKKKLTTVMFRGTKAQEEQLIAVIDKYRDVEGAMMPVLQQAQEIYGYLPIEVMRIIAQRMDVSIEEVYGVHPSTLSSASIPRVRLQSQYVSVPLVM